MTTILSEELWFAEVIVLCIGVTVGSIVAVIHAKYMISDFQNTSKHTKNRTLSSGLPMNLLSFTVYSSIILYLIATFGPLPMYFSAILGMTQYCPYFLQIGACIYFSARMFNYLAFLLRLHIIYNGTKYQYNKNILIFMGIICIIFPICISIMSVIDLYPNAQALYGANSDYVVTCVHDPDTTPKRSFILVSVYDVIFSICFMIAFINPLRKMIKVSTSENKCNAKNPKNSDFSRLIQSGIKCSILVTLQTITTIFLAMFFAAGYTLCIPVDHVTNMVCIMLMTKYYMKKRVYEKLCCGAIKCTKCCMMYCCKYHENENMMMTEVVTTKDTMEPKATVTESGTSQDTESVITES